MFERHGVPHTSRPARLDGRFLLHGTPVVDLASAKTSDTAFYARFFHAMLDRGVYLAPSQFEAGFLSTGAHDGAIDRTLPRPPTRSAGLILGSAA